MSVPPLCARCGGHRRTAIRRPSLCGVTTVVDYACRTKQGAAPLLGLRLASRKLLDCLDKGEGDG